MPAASEGFAWNLFPDNARVCHICRRKLKREDVREHRTIYPGGTIQFICAACFRERSQTPATYPRP